MHCFDIYFQYFKVKELWEHKNSERLAAIIIDIYMYVYMSMAIITIEILSNMETKLVLVLYLDHKPLNIKTTLLRNVNAKVLFMQKNRSSIVYLRLFTLQASPHQYCGDVRTSQQRAEAVNGASV